MIFPSPLAQPEPLRPGAVPPAPEKPRRPIGARTERHVPFWVFAVLVLLGLGLVAYIVTFLGAVAPLVGMILALIPLAGVLLAVRLVDRWEPEPRSVVAFAVLWGAVASVALALGVDAVVAAVIPGLSANEGFASVIQAPVVEEVAKGLGILLLLVFARRSFDGPVDGVVYGALIGAGFAFTENILYFSTALLDGGVGEVTFTFVLRGILSPFAHVMFTAITGYVVGRAVRQGAAVSAPWWVGIAGATALHALWNASALFADFFALYLTLQVPLFVLFVLGVLMLRREEARLTRDRLSEYAAAGWFTPVEVDLLATPAGRRRARAWAAGLPGDRTPQMRALLSESTALAAARQRVITGRDPRAAEEERLRLARVVAARQALFGPS